MATDSPSAKTIKEALWHFEQEQAKFYSEHPLHIRAIKINRPTWERLDRASRAWMRDIGPDPYSSMDAYIIAGMVMLEIGGKHRVTKFRNVVGGVSEPIWLALEEDIFLPDGMVDLIYEAPFHWKTVGHMVDITPLLAEEPHP